MNEQRGNSITIAVYKCSLTRFGTFKRNWWIREPNPVGIYTNDVIGKKINKTVTVGTEKHTDSLWMEMHYGTICSRDVSRCFNKLDRPKPSSMKCICAQENRQNQSINIRRESRTRRFFCHNAIRTNSDTAVKEHIYLMGKTRFSLRVLLSCQNVLEIPRTLWCKYNTMDKWASVASFVQSWLLKQN